MIQVQRINGTAFVINADLIETVEATPDTVITLTTGKKVLVADSPDEVVRKVIAFRREIGFALPHVIKRRDPGGNQQAE
ncbi:MAG: flagellar FlbD family protein [Chloroflexota bacterium]